MEARMEVPLTPDLTTALDVAARQQGTTPELLALDCLREHFVGNGAAAMEPAGFATLADFLGESLGALASGSIRSGGAQMSATPGRSFAKGMEQKRRQGRL